MAELTKEQSIDKLSRSITDLEFKIYFLEKTMKEPNIEGRKYFALTKEWLEIFSDLKKLKSELHKLRPKNNTEHHRHTYYNDDVTYNENGMRSDDPYNPDNWQGHTD